MKKIMWSLIFAVPILCCSAQSKQVKSYLRQIAANKVYIEYLQKAIRIARTGLNTIHDIRQGEFKLHEHFFKGLQEVSPAIRHWSKVADIVSIQVSIIKTYRASLTRLKASRQFTAAETDYIIKVFSKIMDDCSNLTGILADVLTDGSFTMNDDERIKRIELVYATMQNNYRFIQKFARNNAVLAIQRGKEKRGAMTSKKLFNLQ